jgi:hypothetical protein
MIDKLNAYRVMLGNSEGKRPLGRPRHIRGDNLKWIIKK